MLPPAYCYAVPWLILECCWKSELEWSVSRLGLTAVSGAVSTKIPGSRCSINKLLQNLFLLCTATESTLYLSGGIFCPTHYIIFEGYKQLYFSDNFTVIFILHSHHSKQAICILITASFLLKNDWPKPEVFQAGFIKVIEMQFNLFNIDKF